MANDPFDHKVSILMKEWDYCETGVSRFDTIIFGIRGWAVSAFTAILAVTVTQKIPFLILFGILPIVLFWITDALNKSYQAVFVNRTKEIQEYLSSEKFIEDAKNRDMKNFTSPALSSRFDKITHMKRLRYFLRSAFRVNVLIVYSSLILSCILSYVIFLVP